MKLLRTAGLLLLLVIFSTVAQYALADTFPSFVRVTQENSTSLFDGKFNDGTGAAIRFILSDHADSVLVRIKSGQTVLRTIKGVNFAMGDTSVIWNGKTDAGATVRDGSYSIQITTYDKGHSAYTELAYPDASGLSTRGVSVVTNPALKNFGMVYGADNGGIQGGTVGITRFTADVNPWGNSKGVAKLSNTGATVGPSELRHSPHADKDGYIYLVGRTNKQIYRFHTDTMNVALIDTGYGTWYPYGLAIREETNGKSIAVVVNNTSSASALGTDSKILRFRLTNPAATYFGAKDTLLAGRSQVIFWDAVFGRDSVLYATFTSPTDSYRPGIAKFNLAGKTLPLTMADTVWTVRSDSGRSATCSIYLGAAANGSQDVLYYVNARIASGNPPATPVVEGIYAVTNLNSTAPTKTLAYPDKQNNATIAKSAVVTDAVGNIIYFENSNEEIALISPPTGPNTFTLNSPTTISILNSETIAAVRIDADKDGQPDRLNQTVTVIGIVNSINTTASANRFLYSIQDETGGIVITKGSETGGGTVYNIGDRVAATGTVSFNRGTTQLNIANVATDVIFMDANNPVVPITLTIDQYLANPEFYESRYIEIKNVAKAAGSVPWPAAGSDANMTITDGFSSLIMRIDLDSDVDGQPEPVYPISIKGVAAQYTSSATIYNDGYEITLNYYVDITANVAAPPNPHFALISPANGSTAWVGNAGLTFQWRKAVDLNGDALIYQWAPVGFTPVTSGNAAKDTFLVRTGAQLLTLLGTKDTLDLRWTVLTKDPSNPAVVNVDTFTVRLLRWQSYALTNWGFFGDGRINNWKFTPGTAAGSATISGTAPNSRWTSIGSWFGNTVKPGAGQALVLTGKMEFVGGGFESAGSLRVGLFYTESAGALIKTNVDSTRWSGTEAYTSGYLFIPPSGTSGAASWSGLGQQGSIGAVVNGAWLQNDYPAAGAGKLTSNYVLGQNLQTPANAVAGAGIYSFVLSVAPQTGGTSKVGITVTKSDKSYTFSGQVVDNKNPMATDKFNAIAFTLDHNFSTTGLKLTEVKIDIVDSIAIPVANVATAVEGVTEVPTEFGLMQNYPNPFNPSTTIRFALPIASHVTLRVFNMLGQEVVTLVDEVREAGYLQSVWNGKNLTGNAVASGMYIYRIDAKSVSGDKHFVSVNKMMLLK
jgi:flagellar hook assembly protein FlgD